MTLFFLNWAVGEVGSYAARMALNMLYDLELPTLLLLPHECWNYRYAPSSLAFVVLGIEPGDL